MEQIIECEVCRKNDSIGVCSVPGVPYSAAFCSECLHSGAIPYWIAVANTALCGGYDHVADWWRDTVLATLKVCDKSMDQFLQDVDLDLKTLERDLGE